jgi:hypothetical protein
MAPVRMPMKEDSGTSVWVTWTPRTSTRPGVLAVTIVCGNMDDHQHVVFQRFLSALDELKALTGRSRAEQRSTELSRK